MPIKISGATSGSVTIEAPPTGDDTTLSLPDTDDVSLASIDQVKVKNEIINGNFDHWQRASSSSTSGMNADDHWSNDYSGGSAPVSRQAFTIASSANPDNGQENEYYSKTIVTAGTGSSDFAVKYQKIENIRRFAGKNMMLSFFASGNDTGNAVQMSVEVTLDFGVGGSADVTASTVSKFSVGNAVWTEHNIEVVVPDFSGKTIIDESSYIRILFWFSAGSDRDTRTDTLGHQDGSFYLSDVRFYESDHPNRCIRRSPLEEFKLCQRYHYRSTTTSSSPYYGTIYQCHATYTNTTKRFVSVPLVVEMYASPTVNSATYSNCTLINTYTKENLLQFYVEATDYQSGVSVYNIVATSEI